ncbi:MAG: LTA synthase family protein [Lachnospiraceae bacterium]|nr:LTA synthase family protein [Lachnospiraceae bacterium]
MDKLSLFIKNKKLYLSPFASLILVVVISGVSTLLMIYIDPSSFMAFIKDSISNPLLFILNYLPVFLVALATSLLFSNAVFGLTLSSLILILMAVANLIKINMRQDPFIPADLSLAKEVLAILENFDTVFVTKVVLGLTAALAVLICTAIFFRTTGIRKLFRFGGTALIILTLAILTSTVYANNSLYNSFKTNGNIYFKANLYSSKGFLYSFIHDISSLKVEKPEGYNPDEFNELYESFVPSDLEDTYKPNIVMIMCESFSELSENENIVYQNGIDPLENFKKIASDSDTVYGHIIVPHFGGGTADTEFDVLSACASRYIENGLSAYDFIRKPFSSMPSLLKSIGYESIAIHPGYPWFYNRSNVYTNMGFSKFYHLDNSFVPYEEGKGGYISDEATANRIIEKFEKYTESENPLFEFCVTIQNHGPYQYKYKENKISYTSKKELTQEEYAILEGYFEGIHDSDMALKKLIDYFNSIDKPVVLVFFGDHLPGFSNGMQFFDILDYNIDIGGEAEERLNIYKTPFIIWQNNYSKNFFSVKENYEKLDMPENNTVSSNFLGAAFMETLGFNGISPLYDYTNELRHMLPVSTNETFMDKAGNYKTLKTLDSDELNEINYYKKLVYYSLFNN